MAKLERVLPTFIFVVMLGSNLLNATSLALPAIGLAVIGALIPAGLVFGLIRFLTWWIQH
ncbi:hypothetical protein D0501_00495 [Leuconostoc holzapfelii]|uniref:Uncharacterized protein n=1 Tax=Leuconostoc holzapfelii TaxID=434464 RepID=A0ABT2NT93_9LACO|nr:hypothetical protein [Leuconostoc holzapfelii]MCT8388585.1 hypothetical protein [Leuconostoc holzapfelii]